MDGEGDENGVLPLGKGWLRQLAMTRRSIAARRGVPKSRVAAGMDAQSHVMAGRGRGAL